MRCPWLRSTRRNGQNQGRPSRISMWPSRVCMQSRMRDSRAQPKGCRHARGPKGMAQERARPGSSARAECVSGRALRRSRRWPASPMASEPCRVAGGLDVRVLVQVEARADRNPARQILLGYPARARRSATRRWCARDCPAASLMPGSEPLSFRRKRRSSVPSADAAKTTPRQVKRRRLSGSSVDGTVNTS